MIIWGAFIVDPDWTADDFKRLREYVSDKQITHTQFTILTPLPGTQLYRDRRHELLTDDYSCFDTLHAVLPTRLPREEFYQHFAGLYRQTDIGPYYDLVQSGKMTIEDCRRARKCWTPWPTGSGISKRTRSSPRQRVPNRRARHGVFSAVADFVKMTLGSPGP